VKEGEREKECVRERKSVCVGSRCEQEKARESEGEREREREREAEREGARGREG